MGRRSRQNPFVTQKKLKKQQETNDPCRRPTTPYEDIVRDNVKFIKYYRMQNICANVVEWENFVKTIRQDLPSTFRVTGFKDEAKALLNIIKTNLFAEYLRAVAELRNVDIKEVDPPLCLPWYPDGLSYQLHLTRKDIRRSEPLYRLHNFLINETNAGAISRQESVSMIPPIVLDVKPTDKILDMCAAPGSKTAQLIEALHAQPSKYKVPPGFIVANDVDNKRCYMLVHQAKRLNSPCLLVTNHDSAHFPNLMHSNSVEGTKIPLKFNKILCDVPCSGDGTLRKNPDIWLKWNLAQAYGLHGIQYRIARRGVEMLAVNGRLVYSTCSLNPIENEAVLQRLIADAEGALEIIDVSQLLPGLIYKPGLLKWKLASKDVDEIYTTFNEVPEKYHTIIRPYMFPLPEEVISKIGLEKCIRILPHLQDSGGFFVAVLEKKRPLPFEKNYTIHKSISNSKQNRSTVLEENENQGTNVRLSEFQCKRRRLHGYREDPYVFFEENDTDWIELKTFFGLDETFNYRCLLTRCSSRKKKNIYYCSESIRDIVQINEDIIKIINTGVKAFSRCESRHSNHPFRLAQEGLQTTNVFMGDERRIEIGKDDLIVLLKCTDPTKPPSTTELKECIQERCKQLSVGSCIIKYTGENFVLYVVGWRGTSSLRVYVDKNESMHVMRLLGVDLSQLEINKYEKAREESLKVCSNKDLNNELTAKSNLSS